MKLVFPAIEHKQEAFAYRQEHYDYGEAKMHGASWLDDMASYEDWLEKKQRDLTIDDGKLVPATILFAVEGGRLLGTIHVRHKLNDYLLNFGGNIGYGVRPTERRKGNATRMLALALDFCRDQGMDRVLITCDKSNIGSAKTIMNNGGVHENEVEMGDGIIRQRYWIEL